MSLLEEIQRKCKILASRLGSEPLVNWLLWESNGYPDDVRVPDYRIWPLQLKGHFSGYVGSQIQNAPIPWVVLPDKVRAKYERYECRQSVTGIEASWRILARGLRM